MLQSQGNEGTQSSRPEAMAKNVISVGAVRHANTPSTDNDSWTGGTLVASIGPAADGRIKPDVHYWYDNIFTTDRGNTYTTGFGGTSAATPRTAGVLGLIVQMWSENVWGTNPSGHHGVRAPAPRLDHQGAADQQPQQYPFTGTTSDLTRTHQGWGRPNAQIACERAARSLVVSHGMPLTEGQAVTYDVGRGFGERSELQATMTYPDPAGNTRPSVHRINEPGPQGNLAQRDELLGNNGLLAGMRPPAEDAQHRRPRRGTRPAESPAAGDWTVEVRAAEINQDGHLATPGADAVSLVVTGAACDDDDEDGWTVCENDCNDADPAVHPRADRDLNGIDDDCDGTGDTECCDVLHLGNGQMRSVRELRQLRLRGRGFRTLCCY